MSVVEIMMTKRKTTDYKIRYKDGSDRVGSVYLSIDMAKKMGIDGDLIIQITQNKNELEQDGYVTSFIREKETKNKVKFKEDIRELGALALIYISKRLLEEMDCSLSESISLRIPYQKGTGGNACDKKS